MSCENEHDRLSAAGRSEIERRLAALTPMAARVERDRLMFLAGQAQGVEVGGQRSEVRRHLGPAWLWPAAAMSLGATSLALLVALVTRAEPHVVYRDREVLVAEPQQPVQARRSAAAEASAAPITLAAVRRPAAASVPADNYVRTREVALRMGLDAIGGPRAARLGNDDEGPLVTYGDWLQSLTETADGDSGKRPAPTFPNM